jgi:hypothetical protein
MEGKPYIPNYDLSKRWYRVSKRKYEYLDRNDMLERASLVKYMNDMYPITGDKFKLINKILNPKDIDLCEQLPESYDRYDYINELQGLLSNLTNFVITDTSISNLCKKIREVPYIAHIFKCKKYLLCLEYDMLTRHRYPAYYLLFIIDCIEEIKNIAFVIKDNLNVKELSNIVITVLKSDIDTQRTPEIDMKIASLKHVPQSITSLILKEYLSSYHDMESLSLTSKVFQQSKNEHMKIVKSTGLDKQITIGDDIIVNSITKRSKQKASVIDAKFNIQGYYNEEEYTQMISNFVYKKYKKFFSNFIVEGDLIKDHEGEILICGENKVHLLSSPHSEETYDDVLELFPTFTKYPHGYFMIGSLGYREYVNNMEYTGELKKHSKDVKSNYFILSSSEEEEDIKLTAMIVTMKNVDRKERFLILCDNNYEEENLNIVLFIKRMDDGFYESELVVDGASCIIDYLLLVENPNNIPDTEKIANELMRNGKVLFLINR